MDKPRYLFCVAAKGECGLQERGRIWPGRRDTWHCAKRNLLKEIIYPADIANGVFALVAILNKTTGNIINVYGGMANAFVR